MQQQIGAYTVERLLGSGGFGSVYAALHASSGQAVALKTLRAEHAADPKLRRRFELEAVSAQRIQHPNVVQVFDWGRTEQGVHYLAMELLEGESLQGRMQRGGRLGVGEALTIADQLLEALDVIHRASVVHRDVKPANVMLVSTQPPHIKLVDFGICRQIGDTQLRSGKLTTTGSAVGTPGYMAPEYLVDGISSPQSDIYAAAVVIFHMLAGQLPFQGARYAEVVLQICQQDAPRLSAQGDRGARVADVVARGLQRQPAQRWPNAVAFRQALAQAAAQLPADTFFDVAASVPTATTRKDGVPIKPISPKAKKDQAGPTTPFDAFMPVAAADPTPRGLLTVGASIAGAALTAYWMMRADAPVTAIEPVATATAVSEAVEDLPVVEPPPTATAPQPSSLPSASASQAAVVRRPRPPKAPAPRSPGGRPVCGRTLHVRGKVHRRALPVSRQPYGMRRQLRSRFAKPIPLRRLLEEVRGRRVLRQRKMRAVPGTGPQALCYRRSPSVRERQD